MRNEILERAAQLIEQAPALAQQLYFKPSSMDPTCFCGNGAIYMALHEAGQAPHPSKQYWWDEFIVKCIGYEAFSNIVDFNDTPGRTTHEVAAYLRSLKHEPE